MKNIATSLFDDAWQWTKVAGILYVLGLLITTTYFLRFSILSLDLLRPQSVLVGGYFSVLYFLLPICFLLLLRRSRSVIATFICFTALLVVKDLAFFLLLGFASAYVVPGEESPFVPLLPAVPLLVLLQVTLFGRLATGAPGVARLRFEILPQRPVSAVAAVILLLTFGHTVYGSIPGYLAGGRPSPVHVFTDNPELPANRFMETRNKPQINPAHISFRLNLLYESEDYYYFVARKRADRIKGYSIMRLQRDEVLRIDYITPTWFDLGGG